MSNHRLELTGFAVLVADEPNANGVVAADVVAVAAPKVNV